MAEGVQVSTDFPGAVVLEYYVWNDASIHKVIIESNNFTFINNAYIIKSLIIKENFGVILNELPFVIYTNQNTNRNEFPVTVRALRIIELNHKEKEQVEYFNFYKKNRPHFYTSHKIFIDKLLDIPKLERTGEYVTVRVVNGDPSTYRRVSIGFYKKYEIDVPLIHIHHGTLVTIIDKSSEIPSMRGNDEFTPYELPHEWEFMCIQDAHEPKSITKLKKNNSSPSIRFYLWDEKSYKETEIFKTKILRNVIAIEIINAKLLVTNDKGEKFVFYTTVHLLAAYMNNRDIRLNESYWGPINTASTDFVTKNSFSIVEDISNEQPLLYLKSPRDKYDDVYEQLLNIAPFKVHKKAEHLKAYDDKLNVYDVYPGFYNRHEMYDVEKKTFDMKSVWVQNDIKVTVIYDNNEYTTYENRKDPYVVVVPDNVVYIAIQISHKALSYNNEDVVINIYTRDRKYTHNDIFDIDDLPNVISIELINAYLTFYDGIGKHYIFYNTVYFLPTYVGNNSMYMPESTWENATYHTKQNFYVKSKIRQIQEILTRTEANQPIQVQVPFEPSEIFPDDLKQIGHVQTTQTHKEKQNPLVTQDFKHYPLQFTLQVVPTKTQTDSVFTVSPDVLMTNTLDFARSIDFSQSYFDDSLSYSFIENPSTDSLSYSFFENPSTDLLQSYEDSFSYSTRLHEPLIITKTNQIYLGNSVPVYQSETPSTNIPILSLGLEEQSLILSDQSQGQVQLPPQWTHVTSYSEEREVLVIPPEERTEEQLIEEQMKRELITPRIINTDDELNELEKDLMKSPFQPSRAIRKKPTPVPTPTPPTPPIPEPTKKTEPKPESEWNLYYYIAIALIFIIINVGIVFFMWYFII